MCPPTRPRCSTSTCAGRGDRGARRRTGRRPARRAHLLGRGARRGARARSGTRPARTAAATCRSTSAPSTRARWRRWPTAERAGIELVAINPSSVQGPGRAGGTGRILIAYLNGRLNAFIDTGHQHRRHRRLRRGAHARRRARPRRRALRDQRRGDHVAARRSRSCPRSPACATACGSSRRSSRAPSATAVEAAFRVRGKHAAGVPRDGPHDAARPSLRRLARRRASWASSTRPVEDTFRRTIEWARAEGLVTG